MAHVATSYEGASFVDREGGIESLVRIAETSNVLSLKVRSMRLKNMTGNNKFHEENDSKLFFFVNF